MGELQRSAVCLVLVTVLGCGKSPLERIGEAFEGPAPPAPTEEVFVALPEGLPVALGPRVLDALVEAVAEALPGTSFNFFMAENQELLAQFTVPDGSAAYRKKKARLALAPVIERLDPELAAGSRAVELIAIPASVRKYRRSDLPPRIVIVGSPMTIDREGEGSITTESSPCDGCVTLAGGPYARMASFPDGSTLRWLTPEANYGNGPNHREQVENHLRFVIQTKNARLVRLSSDPGVVFRDGGSQWDGDAVPADDCDGRKKAAEPPRQVMTYSADGSQAVNTQTGQRVRVLTPDPDRLLGPRDRVVFLIDESGSVAFAADGSPRPEPRDSIHRDVTEKLRTMEFREFAVIAFAGDARYEPRLNVFPRGLLGGIGWAEATPANRERAVRFLGTLQPGGGTPTGAALAKALELEGPLTCLLYSDGLPTLGAEMEGVLKQAKGLKSKGMTVNTIGVGALSVQCDEFDWTGGDFMTRLAHATGGEYFALGPSPKASSGARPAAP